MIITKALNLYLGAPAAVQRPVFVSQNDTGWAFACTIYQGTQVWTIPSGTTATINGSKPDGTAFSYTCTISGNVVTAPCEEQMTVVPGNVDCEIKFTQGGRVIATANFRLIVEESPTGEYKASETELGALDDALDEVQTIAAQVRAAYGAPLTAATSSAMTDTSRVYVYTGTTSGGFTKGNWYYYNGSSWVSGGVYNSTAFETDATLSISGAAADAKATGDAVGDLKSSLSEKTDNLFDSYSVRNSLGNAQYSDGVYSGRNLHLGSVILLKSDAMTIGKTYRISFDLRCSENETASQSALGVTIRNASNTNLKWVQVRTATTDWARNIIYCTIPDGANVVRFGERLSSQKTFYVRDIMVTESVDNVPTVPDITAVDYIARSESLRIGVDSDEYTEKTTNLFKLGRAADAVPKGVYNNGVFTGTNADLRYIPLMPHGEFTPNEEYTISFDVCSNVDETDSSSSLNVATVSAEGNIVDTIFLSPATTEWRRFVAHKTIHSEAYTVFLSRNRTSDTVFSVKDICIERGYTNGVYTPSICASDYVARSMANDAIGQFDDISEQTNNLFHAFKVAKTLQGVSYDNGVFTGTNSALKDIVLIPNDQLDVDAQYTVSFDFRSETEETSTYSALGVMFANSDGERTGDGRFLTPSTQWRRVTLRFGTGSTVAEIPTDAYLLRFRERVDSDVVFNIRNICVERGITGGDYIPAYTAVDITARNAIENKVNLYDGYVLRMASLPDAIPVGDAHLGYYAFMTQTWETFRTDYPDNVTRETRWTSVTNATNTDAYPVYRYIITPEMGYDKTIFLTAACHGNEAEGYYGLYRIMRMIYDEGYKYPNLRNLRNHVRFIVIPVWSPWAVEHWTRTNAIGVNPYAIFGKDSITAGGSEYTLDDIGESKAVVDTLDEYGSDIVGWIDFHTDPFAGRYTPERGDTPAYGCYGFAKEQSRMGAALYDVMTDFKNIMRDDYNFNEVFHPVWSSAGSTGHPTYALGRGIDASIVEISTFMDGFPYASGSAEMMRLAQEYFANMLASCLA